MTTRQLLSGVLATAAIVAGGAAAAAAQSPPDKSGGKSPVTLTLLNSDDQDLTGVPGLQRFIDRVRTLSGGTVRIEVRSQSDGHAGFEQRVVRDVKANRFQLAWVGTRVWDTLGVKSFRALHAPMLVDSYPVEAAVLRSDLPREDARRSRRQRRRRARGPRRQPPVPRRGREAAPRAGRFQGDPVPEPDVGHAGGGCPRARRTAVGRGVGRPRRRLLLGPPRWARGRSQHVRGQRVLGRGAVRDREPRPLAAHDGALRERRRAGRALRRAARLDPAGRGRGGSVLADDARRGQADHPVRVPERHEGRRRHPGAARSLRGRRSRPSTRRSARTARRRPPSTGSPCSRSPCARSRSPSRHVASRQRARSRGAPPRSPKASSGSAGRARTSAGHGPMRTRKPSVRLLQR